MGLLRLILPHLFPRHGDRDLNGGSIGKWQSINPCHFLSGAVTAKLTAPHKLTYFFIDLRKTSSAFFAFSSATSAFSSAILALSSAIFRAFSARAAASFAFNVAASDAALAACASFAA